ncbi:sushi domain-containing protein 1 isoform X11 [Lepidochelys kempii]|uniref:sushi domain-containing protein 1 isoform X11 n=1 Tax=Lepidochelys kempii TaxID=8472 RepID=UPI003C704B44
MSPPGTAAGGGLAARRPRRLRLPLLWLLLWLHAARPAQGQRAATNSSVPDVCATCHANATCQQKEGKNVCICNYGFVGNGRTHCQDKDECQIGASKICGEHTSCHNTHGSFYCICLEGYHPSNNNKIFIPNDGTYCTDIDECQVSGLCGVGGRCVNTVGSYSCYCMEGYRPENGTEFFHPAGNTVSCKAVDCGVPPSVLNAHSAPLRRTTYGSEVAYICLHGYVMESGNQTAVCNAKGQWEGADLVCKEIDCGRPLWIPHAEMIWDNSTTLGSMVYYKCSEGFHFSGKKNFSQCTIIQKWENIAGACEVTDCGRPPSIPNTDMIWNNISQLGSSVHYQCKKGFRSINGRNTSRCIYNGSWEIPAIICKEVDCGIPPPIQHAELMSNPSSSPGSVVQYSCQKGFEYAGGNNISVCTEEGVWVKSTLTCTVKAAIGNVSIFNKTCVKWRRSTRETNLKMVYLFHIQGRRWHQEAFFHEAVFNFTAEEETPELCLDLQAGMNYTVNITVVSPEPSRPVTVTIKTVEEEGFGNVSVFNDTCLKWRRRSGRIGVKETYLFHIQEQQGYLLKSSHETMINFTTEKENPEVCLPLPLGVNYTLTITEASTKLVLQIPITLPATEEELLSNVSIFNETCVKWQRKVARAGTKETYTFRILGRRWYQKEFSREMIFNFTTGEETPEVCLELNSGANYMVNITTASSKGTSALITIAIKTEVKEAFSNMRILNDTCLTWRRSIRSADRKEIYSFHIQGRRWYQKEFFHERAFNLTIYGQTPEVCLDLHPGTNYTVNISTAALDLSVLVSMTTPIIDLSPTLQHMTLAGLGSVTAICLILFLSFLAARSYLHSTVQVPPAALAKGVSYETTMDAAGVGIASSFLEIESVSLL